MILAAIPSPTQGVWTLGPVPIRAYALCIIIGVLVAVWLGERRWVARGGESGDVVDIAVVAVPLGVLGARMYHVLSSPDAYFGADGNLVDALKIWEGGLGIWGGIAFGGIGVWLVCRRRGIKVPPMADAIAPGIVLAQAIGRLGNWFNNELYGRPTDAPWGLTIYQQAPGGGRAATGADGQPIVLGTFEPTFLYELVWNLGVAALVIWADRRFRLGRGRAFALYVAAYCAGRVWIEALRIDPAEMVFGLRLNVWTSILVFGCAVAWILTHRGSREDEVYRPGRRPERDGATETDAEPETEPEVQSEAGAGTEPGGEADDPEPVDRKRSRDG
ncbi:prolipoprotein diacylglyceryl transferase [soil metagenome]